MVMMDFSQSWWNYWIQFFFHLNYIYYIRKTSYPTLKNPFNFFKSQLILKYKKWFNYIPYLNHCTHHNVLWSFGKSCLIQTMSFSVTCEKTLSLQKITTQLNDEIHIYIDIKVWHLTFSLWNCKFSININSNKV
jgi:hypothetical protein